MRDAQADPEIIERLRNGGRAPLVLGPEELKAFMAAEVQKWEVLVRDAKIEPI
jgi:tripartite-type tricarboxylate transporter receptor subunit TctC